MTNSAHSLLHRNPTLIALGVAMETETLSKNASVCLCVYRVCVCVLVCVCVFSLELVLLAGSDRVKWLTYWFLTQHAVVYFSDAAPRVKLKSRF